MADTVINLSQVVGAVQQDNNILADITNICKAINKVSINGLDVATVTSNVNIIKGLSNSIKPILQTLNGLQVELNKVDITNISDLSTSLNNIKTISNSVLELVGDFNSDSTELSSKISSITETGVQLASFAAAIYCPALKSGQVAKGLLAGLNSLGDGLKANNGMSLDDVMNKQGLNPLLMGSIKTANSVLIELVDLDLEEWGDEAMKTMVGDKVSLITAIGSLVKNYSNSLYKNEKTGLLVDLKSLNEVMNKTSELQNLKPGSFNAIYEQLNEILESLTFDALHILTSDFDFEEINKSYDGINKILQGTNTIFATIADMNDSKKNPVLSQKFDLSTIKNNIGSTFDSLEDIVVVFGDKFDALHILVGDFDFEEINKSYDEVNKILQSTNTIFATIADMNDPKKNPVLSQKFDLSTMKNNISSTFDSLEDIVVVFGDKFDALHILVGDFDFKEINKSYDEVNKILQSTNTIFATIADMNDPKKNPVLSQKFDLSTIKNNIGSTFDSLEDIVVIFGDKFDALHILVGDFDFEEINKSYDGVSKIFQSINTILTSVIDMSDSNKNNLIGKDKKVQKVQGDIKNTLAALVEIIKNIKEDLSSFGDIVDSISIEDINKSYEEVSKVFQCINTILTAINDMVDIKKNPLINPVKLLVVKMVIKHTFNSLVGLVESILNHMEKFEKIVNQLNIEEVTKAYESINSVFQSVSNILKAVNELPILMLKFMITAPIVIVGLPIVGAMLLGLWGVLKLISLIKFDKIANDLTNTSKAFEEITNVMKGIEELVKHMVIVALIMVPAIIAASIITLGLLALAGVLWLMGLVVKLMGGKWVAEGRSNVNDLIKLMLSITALVLSLILLAIVMQPTIEISTTVLIGLSVIAIVTFGIALLIWGLSKIVSKIKISDILKVAGLFIMVTIVAVIFLGLAIILVKTQEYAEQIKVGVVLAFIGGMIALAVAFAALGYACSAASAVLLPAMVGILALTGAMLVVLGAFLGMAVILNKIQETNIDAKIIKEKSGIILESSKDICAIAIGIAKELGLKELKDAKKSFKKMNDLVDQVLEMTETLNKISAIELNSDNITKNTTLVFTTANKVITTLSDKDENPLAVLSGKEMAKSMATFKSTLTSFKLLFKDLKKLVDILTNIQKVELNTEATKANIALIFSTANQVVSSFGNEDGTGVSPETIEKNGFKFKATLIAFKVIFEDLEKLVSILNDVQKVKLDGKVITDSINVVFQTANEIIEKIVNNENVSLDKLKEDKKEFDKISNQYKAIFEDFTKLTDILAGVDIEKFKNQTNGGFVGIITDIAAASKKLEEVDGEKINKTLNSYGDFLKKVDNVNLKKLETSAKMFEEMARFSESINGNFDKMADTLNDKIGPLLEDLKNTLNDVHIQVTENGAQAQANTDRIVEKQEIREQMQASGQTQNLTVEEVDRRIDRKYQENVQQRYGIDEIASKLATLIDLFQSGEAVVKTT